MAMEMFITYAHRRVDRYWRPVPRQESDVRTRHPSEKRIRELIAHYAHRCAVCGGEHCAAHAKAYIISRQLPYGFCKMGDCVIHNEDLVENIRIIFDTFVQMRGHAPDTIRYLRFLGIGAPRGRAWYRSSLMTIVQDTAYSGDRSGFQAMVPAAVGRLARRLARKDHRRVLRAPKSERDAVGRWVAKR